MSRDKKHTSNECSEQRAKTQMACKNLDLNHVGPIETQYTNTAPASKSQGAVIHQMFAAIPQKYVH